MNGELAFIQDDMDSRSHSFSQPLDFYVLLHSEHTAERYLFKNILYKITDIEIAILLKNLLVDQGGTDYLRASAALQNIRIAQALTPVKLCVSKHPIKVTCEDNLQIGPVVI